MTSDRLILIAENDPDMAALLLWHLGRLGHRTVAVPDGRTAVRRAFDQQPDLLILDLMLPELHGFTVCQILKHSRRTQQIPILIVTAANTAEKRQIGLRLGANDFVGKPVAMPDLIQRVESLLLRHNPGSTSSPICNSPVA